MSLCLVSKSPGSGIRCLWNSSSAIAARLLQSSRRLRQQSCLEEIKGRVPRVAFIVRARSAVRQSPNSGSI
nr:MAG TPA: hypothetical protein [Caudoviricetes sp.]